MPTKKGKVPVPGRSRRLERGAAFPLSRGERGQGRGVSESAGRRRNGPLRAFELWNPSSPTLLPWGEGSFAFSPGEKGAPDRLAVAVVGQGRAPEGGRSLVIYLPYSQSLLDPPGSHPLAAAVGWLQGTLLGTVATTLAVIAVAAVGMMMLTGRINVRRGASVVFGCFILFGASSIAAGILPAVAAADFGSAPLPPPYQPEVEAPPPALVTPPPAPAKPPAQN